MKQKSFSTLWAGLLVMALLPWAVPADAQHLYVTSGRAYGLQESTTAVSSTATSAIPGVTTVEPDPVDPTPAGAIRHDVRSPLPGVTVRAYLKESGALLGTGRANREGFFRVEYQRPAVADHEVVFHVSLDFAGGGSELVGQSEPILVDDQLFSFELEVPIDESLRGGTPVFSTAGQFVWVEVGDVDMDNIWDEEADPPGDPECGADACSDLWGLTKQTSTGGFDTPFNGHNLGPGLAFGGTLELYGLFESTSSARYYRISYNGPASGVVTAPLFKKNYVIVGTGIEVHRIKLGPQTVGAEDNLYRLDEFMEGQPIPGSMPPRNFSGFWTELGMRAKLSTAGLPDGKYTFEVEAFDGTGAPLPPPGVLNDFATLSLHLVNTPPTARIHTIQYLNGGVVLSDAAPCQTVLLDHTTPSTDDDNLQFEVTARHAGGFLRQWNLTAFHGHDALDGTIAEGTSALSFPLAPAGPSSQIFVTPPSITYQSCAYRFHLRVWPRITNGYHIIYRRDDNWYAAIQVHP